MVEDLRRQRILRMAKASKGEGRLVFSVAMVERWFGEPEQRGGHGMSTFHRHFFHGEMDLAGLAIGQAMQVSP